MLRQWVAFPPNTLPVVWARLAQQRFRVPINTGAAAMAVINSKLNGYPQVQPSSGMFQGLLSDLKFMP